MINMNCVDGWVYIIIYYLLCKKNKNKYICMHIDEEKSCLQSALIQKPLNIFLNESCCIKIVSVQKHEKNPISS